MAVRSILRMPFRPQLSDDSASNRGSSVAGDDFDDDASSDPGGDGDTCSEPPSNIGSLAGDCEDEDLSWITQEDDAALRNMNLHIIGTRDGSRFNGSNNMLHQVSILPKGTKPVKLVGEGAANAVFEIKIPPNSRVIGTQFKGKLLRVAKVPAIGKAPTSSYVRQQEFFHADIRPRLGDYAVRQELVVLHRSGIVEELNVILAATNQTRDPKFRGSFIGPVGWGFLVEDMRPDGDKSHLIEFKPKWLLQSPSAPENAIRCRQCALRLRNYVYNPSTNKPCPESKPCPLTLGNSESPRQVSSPFRIASQPPGMPMDCFRAALEQITNHTAIHMLREEQEALDRVGPLQANSDDRNFVIAMTLRDCTCFALVPVDKNEPIKIRLGDFDWKDPKTKFDYWCNTEQDLIKGGFYTADWIVCGDSYYHPPSLCLLEWPSVKRTDKPEILLIQEKNPTDKIASLQPDALLSRLESTTAVYTHKTDVEVLQRGLEKFKRKPAGTPPDAAHNPFRSDPVSDMCCVT